MGFADSYLKKHRLYGELISHGPNGELGSIVVVPCYDEEGITKVLDSLWEAQRPGQAVEVIVVVNASENDPPEVHMRNRQTVEEIEKWGRQHQEEAFQVHALYIPD